MEQAENQALLSLLVVACIGFFLYVLSPILTPFFVATFLAYLANPLVDRLVRLRLSRLMAVIIVFTLMFAFAVWGVIALIPLIQNQIDTLGTFIPNVLTWLQDQVLPWVQGNLGVNPDAMDIPTVKEIVIKNWSKAGNVVDAVLMTILHSSSDLIRWFILMLLVPVVTFYLMFDWHFILRSLCDALPRRSEATVISLVKECNSVLNAFFRGQLIVMIALGIVYSAGLALIGLSLSVLIGFTAGILNIVPTLGSIVGLAIASIAAYVQFGSMNTVMWVFIVFVIGHALDGMVLTPYLIGNRIGLHPVAVIFAVLAGGCLFGFMGVLLALPVAAMLMVWMRYFYAQYRRSPLYNAR